MTRSFQRRHQMDMFGYFGRGISDRRGLDDADESISFARVGFYVARLLGIVIQRPAQFLNRAVQTSFEVNEYIVPPQPLAQFFACHQLTGTIKQEIEHLKRLARQPYPLSVLAEFSPSAVDHVRAESNRVNRIGEFSRDYFVFFH